MSAIAVLALALATAAPMPKVESVYYYPTKEGTKWTYLHSNGTETTSEVIKAEKSAGGIIVTCATIEADGTVSPKEKCEISNNGVLQLAAGEHDGTKYVLKPRNPILWRFKVPAKEGEQWEGEVQGMMVTFTAGKVETIKVPAGQFDAIPVDMVYKHKDSKQLIDITAKYWFAAGFGLVKFTSTHGNRQPTVTVLQSYSLPTK